MGYFDGDGDFPNRDDRDGYPDTGEVRCKHCRERFLHWETVEDGKHALFDEDGVRHDCLSKPAEASSFEAIE